jgi:hypothetical protein
MWAEKTEKSNEQKSEKHFQVKLSPSRWASSITAEGRLNN